MTIFVVASPVGVVPFWKWQNTRQRSLCSAVCVVVRRIEAPDGWMTLHPGVHDGIQGNDQALTSDPWIGGCFCVVKTYEVAPLEGA